jgi:hypothetical protein
MGRTARRRVVEPTSSYPHAAEAPL